MIFGDGRITNNRTRIYEGKTALSLAIPGSDNYSGAFLGFLLRLLILFSCFEIQPFLQSLRFTPRFPQFHQRIIQAL